MGFICVCVAHFFTGMFQQQASRIHQPVVHFLLPQKKICVTKPPSFPLKIKWVDGIEPVDDIFMSQGAQLTSPCQSLLLMLVAKELHYYGSGWLNWLWSCCKSAVGALELNPIGKVVGPQSVKQKIPHKFGGAVSSSPSGNPVRRRLHLRERFSMSSTFNLRSLTVLSAWERRLDRLSTSLSILFRPPSKS